MLPRRPDVAPRDKRAERIARLVALQSLPTRTRVVLVVAPMIPLAAWVISTVFVLRAQLPFPTRAIALLGALGALLVIPVALITFRRFLVRGVTPSFKFVGLMAAVAAVVPFLVGTVPPFSLPEPTPVPGAPTLFVSAAPYGNDDLWVIEGGGDVREGDFARLTDSAARELDPSISPDGSSLVYSSNVDGSFDLWLFPMSDARPVGDPQKLTHEDSGDEYGPRWSPDGRKIAFTSRRGDHTDIILIDADGGRARPVTDDGDSLFATWSPDGRRLAFSRPTRGDPDNFAIWTMPARGGDPELLVDTPGDDLGVVWLSDGRRFAFTASTHQMGDVWIGDIDGRALIDLTPNTTGWSDIAYAIGPENDVLFTSDRAPTQGNFLYFMQADGSNVTLAAII